MTETSGQRAKKPQQVFHRLLYRLASFYPLLAIREIKAIPQSQNGPSFIYSL